MAGTEKAGAAFKSVKVPLETWRRLRILAAQTDDSIAGVIGRMAAVFSAAKPKVREAQEEVFRIARMYGAKV